MQTDVSTKADMGLEVVNVADGTPEIVQNQEG